VDVLLLSDFPSGILNQSASSTLEPSTDTSRSDLQRLICTLKPRYIFTVGTGLFVEREPFRNNLQHDQPASVTRFISLDAFRNERKGRWFYAMNLEPLKLAAAPLDMPENVTPSPFDIAPKRRRPQDEDRPRPTSEDRKRRPPPEGYICRICSVPGHYIQDCPQKQERAPRQQPPVQPQECWFCLSSPNFAKHLIVAVGDECYLTLPKGELVPHHVLVVPIEHVSSFENLSKEARDEVERYKHTMDRYYQTQGCRALSLDVSFRSMHACLQIVPIPKTQVDEFAVFLREFNSGISWIQGQPSNDVFMRFTLPSGEQWVHSAESQGGYMDLKFPRKVLAAFLEVQGREDWRGCTKSEDQEAADAKRLREVLKL